ncbi:hypothetical protein MRS76_18570 [Rhizobiaceae bacterium n13]|uniref:Uncharacterized protein n=1 Tax=Ferirhizobium litorale TaxID=2927786 RepID=A0AAE3U5M5_9HYPH|nr:hypothetical protein [Fererhizobium litorale]MDI7863958.1 hypothetical protein [Fererhizobium litorale]MDI7924209.1 hypothetical protein [Fererhizobium litorale]
MVERTIRTLPPEIEAIDISGQPTGKLLALLALRLQEMAEGMAFVTDLSCELDIAADGRASLRFRAFR